MPSGDQLMTFGKYKTWMFKEVPQNYLEWAIKEVAANQGASPELVHFANWSRTELATRKAKAENAVGVAVDPEVSAVIPVPEMDASVKSVTSVMTWTSRSSVASRMASAASAQAPKAKPMATRARSKREAETVEIVDGMDVQVPVEVIEELDALNARTAALRQEHHLPPAGQVPASKQ